MYPQSRLAALLAGLLASSAAAALYPPAHYSEVVLDLGYADASSDSQPSPERPIALRLLVADGTWDSGEFPGPVVEVDVRSANEVDAFLRRPGQLSVHLRSPSGQEYTVAEAPLGPGNTRHRKWFRFHVPVPSEPGPWQLFAKVQTGWDTEVVTPEVHVNVVAPSPARGSDPWSDLIEP